MKQPLTELNNPSNQHKKGSESQDSCHQKSSKIINIKKSLYKPFFARAAEIVAPELIGCKLVKREKDGNYLFGVIVETEAYSELEPACHGFKRRTKSNETLFGEPGIFYIYLTYGIYYCVNIVTHKTNWASGVLLRAIALPNENEKVAAGPALLARRFGLNRSHDGLPLSVEHGFWVAERPASLGTPKIIQTTRIGISKAKDLPWRWYLQNSRSISKRQKGDHCPNKMNAWYPSMQPTE